MHEANIWRVSSSCSSQGDCAWSHCQCLPFSVRSSLYPQDGLPIANPVVPFWMAMAFVMFDHSFFSETRSPPDLGIPLNVLVFFLCFLSLVWSLDAKVPRSWWLLPFASPLLSPPLPSSLPFLSFSSHSLGDLSQTCGFTDHQHTDDSYIYVSTLDLSLEIQTHISPPYSMPLYT